MATIQQPNQPTPSTPPIPPGSNVASLTNQNTLSTLQQSQSPKTFGDQAKKIGGAVIIAAVTQSKLASLYKEKAVLIQEGIQLDINHQKTLLELEQKHTPKKQIKEGKTVEVPAELNDQEYQDAVTIENGGTLTNGQQVEGIYPTAQKNLQKRKDKNQKDIDDIIKDPFKKQKEAKKKRQSKKEKQQKRTKEEKRKARKAQSKAVLQNAKKSLAPVLTLLLTNKIADVVSQNSKIKKLVDDTNAIITEANESGDSTKLQNAKLARDNAIKIIQSNEDKINKIRQQIKTIQVFITIFTIIVNIISAIPIPTAVPPGIGIPVNLIIKLVKILDKANRILLTLSAVIPIILSIFDSHTGTLAHCLSVKREISSSIGELIS